MGETEQIGKIMLDYTCYPGEDLYCDGAVEDELTAIVQQYPASEYQRVIENKASWPIFYHLSALRGNIVEWLPLSKRDKVLEIGSGCGAVTGTLADKAGEVTCIDLSAKRSRINAWRNRQHDNVTIHVGNFQDIEPILSCDYDYIFLIGVFEYGQSYIGTDAPYEDFLAIVRRHAAAGGRIVLAIENKFGLKYWAGCKEDHLGTWFSGIEDYAAGGGVRTFTRNGLEKICAANGIDSADCHFYYPYPDYKFPTCIYSDARLPQVGELSTNLCNYDRDRLLLFDEKNAFDGIIREGLFPLYSNSYLLLIGPAVETKYSKYSNDRAPEFAIRTDILERNGAKLVQKTAVTPQGMEHIAGILESCISLQERYRGSGANINRCERGDAEGSVRLEYLSGRTLEELLDERLDEADEAGFLALFERYRQTVSYGLDEMALDYDLIFGNIMVSGGEWTILDYEWSRLDCRNIFGREMSTFDVVVRALYCYMLGAWKRRKLSLELIDRMYRERAEQKNGEAARAESRDALLERLTEQEAVFQNYVTGQSMALSSMRDRIGCAIVPVQQLALRETARWSKKRVQIYLDTGNGFSEQESYFVEEAYADRMICGEGNQIVLRLSLPEQVKAIRIDPAMEACLLTEQSWKLTFFGGDTKEIRFVDKTCLLNGDLISENTAVFATQDPHVTLDCDAVRGAHQGEMHMEAAFMIAPLPADMAAAAALGMPKKRWFPRKTGDGRE